MNDTLSKSAKHGLSAPQFPSEPNWCSKWVRLVVEHAYGKGAFREYFKKNARLTALAFSKSPYNVPRSRGSVVGDILFQAYGHGPHGHVGIRINGNKVAENSSVHVSDGDTEARGVRTLKEFGEFSHIVRLPPLAEYLESLK